MFDFLAENEHLKEIKSMVDLGAGDGRVVLYATEYFNINAVGLEINRELIDFGRKKIKQKKLAKKCQILEADFYNFDISQFDLIYCFTLPKNHISFKHILQNVKLNAIIISIRYPFVLFRELLGEIGQIKSMGQFTIYFYRKKA